MQKKFRDYCLFSFSRRKKFKSNAVAVLKEVKERGNDEEPSLELTEVDESTDLEHIVHEDPDNQREILHEDLDDQRNIVHAAIVHVEAIPTCTKDLSTHLPVQDGITTLDRQRTVFENHRRGALIHAQRLTPGNDISIEDLEWSGVLGPVANDDVRDAA